LLLVSMEVAVAESCAHIFALGSADKMARIHEGSSTRAEQEGLGRGSIPERLRLYGVPGFEVTAVHKIIEDMALELRGLSPQ
jgi:hypothetical protein